jgi:hypothetical protein
VSHRGYRRSLALDGVESALDPALAGEDLLDLRGVDWFAYLGLGRLHPEDAATAGHRSPNQH